MSKKIWIFIIVLGGAVLLEMLFFNFQPIKDRIMSNKLLNQKYELSDFEQHNWSVSGEVIVSAADPILVLHDLNYYVSSVAIQYKVQGALDRIDLFYVDEQHPVFSGEALIQTQVKKPEDTRIIYLGKTIQKLRIDMGDISGLVLEEFVVVLNPSIIHLSVARIVTMLIIFYTAKILFSLQKSPDYSCLLYTSDAADE